MAGDTPWQQVDPPSDYRLPLIDLSELPPTEIESELKRSTSEFIDAAVDLSVGPLFAARLWRVSSCEHVFIVTVEHIVLDAYSNSILDKEIWEIYRHGVHGVPMSLSQLPVQFADYANWKQDTYPDWFARYGTYWRDHLADAPCVEIQADSESIDRKEPGGLELHVAFGKDLSDRLRELAQREQTLVSMVVLTAYVVVMSRWLKQNDLILVFVSHGRHDTPTLRNVIGFFASQTHLRVRISAEDTFHDLLKKIQRELHSAFEQQDFDRVLSMMPDYNSELIFNWLPYNGSRLASALQSTLAIPLQIQPFPVDSSLPFVPAKKLMPLFYYKGPEIHLNVYYRSDLLSHDTVDLLSHNVMLVADEFIKEPHAKVAAHEPA